MTPMEYRDDFANFYEEVGRHFPEEEVVYRSLRGRLRKEFVLELLNEETGSFLDIGCNAGIYITGFEGHVAVGIDLSPSVLRRAKQRCMNSRLKAKCHFIAGDAQNLDFIRHIQFDFILCSEVLEHLLHPERVLSCISRILKPGGRALITTPNYRGEKPTWVPMGLLRLYLTGEKYYHTAYRPEELSQMAQTAGLTVLEAGTLEWEVKYAAKPPAVLFVLLRWLNRLTFKMGSLDRFNQRLYDSLTLLCYRVARLLGLENIFRRLIREGVRSYVIVGHS